MSPPTKPVRPSLRAIILPREHGSWSLALEPVALGLIAAPGWRGAALALAAVALFLARRPLQVTRARDARRATASAVVAGLGGIAVAACAAALTGADRAVLLALLAALPAALAFAWFDLRKAGREAAAEVCGAAVFAAFPAAIALAAGWRTPAALLLAGFALARSLTSILPIRAFLRGRKGERISRWPALATAGGALLAFSALAARGAAWVPAAWCGVFAVRTFWLLGPSRPAWTARRLGMTEAGLGIVAIITTAIALR